MHIYGFLYNSICVISVIVLMPSVRNYKSIVMRMKRQTDRYLINLKEKFPMALNGFKFVG